MNLQITAEKALRGPSVESNTALCVKSKNRPETKNIFEGHCWGITPCEKKVFRLQNNVGRSKSAALSCQAVSHGVYRPSAILYITDWCYFIGWVINLVQYTCESCGYKIWWSYRVLWNKGVVQTCWGSVETLWKGAWRSLKLKNKLLANLRKQSGSLPSLCWERTELWRFYSNIVNSSMFTLML